MPVDDWSDEEGLRNLHRTAANRLAQSQNQLSALVADSEADSENVRTIEHLVREISSYKADMTTINHLLTLAHCAQHVDSIDGVAWFSAQQVARMLQGGQP